MGDRQLVLLRHGESLWNHEHRFTGWADVGLTDLGCEQVRQAGQAIQDAGLVFDVAYTSVLRRCIDSQQLLLDMLGYADLQQVFDWRLNERHYGALTGRAKADAVAEYGQAAVRAWRRGYEATPPPVDELAAAHIPLDDRYHPWTPEKLPLAESLADTVRRVFEVWRDRIVPDLEAGRRVLVTGHGNGLRALVKLIENLSDEAVVGLEVDNSAPMVYRLDASLRPTHKQTLPVPHRPRSTIL